MSNASLHERMSVALTAYRKGESTLAQLRNAVNLNGRALEAMPYALIQELSRIEHLLLLAQYAEEEDCIPDVATALEKLDTWLSAVPHVV